MEDIGGLVGFIFWLAFIWFISALVKVSKKKKAKKTAGNAFAVPTAEAPAAAKSAAGAETKPEVPFRTESAPFAPRTDAYVGSLGVIANGPGSMGGESGEGIDPCHEEQSREMDLLETVQPPEEGGESFLPQFSGSEIAKAFVMSEILNRKRA